MWFTLSRGREGLFTDSGVRVSCIENFKVDIYIYIYIYFVTALELYN